MSFKQNSSVRIPQSIKFNKSEASEKSKKETTKEVKKTKPVKEEENKKEISFINCTVEDVDKDAPFESKTEFSILARPYIRDSNMYTGDVTITISKCGNVVESTYTIYYFLNGAWKAVIHKRLGAPLTMAEVIDEFCWILPSHVDDSIEEETNEYLNFNTHLAEEFIKRMKYFSRHIKLTKRYSIARSLILGDVN